MIHPQEYLSFRKAINDIETVNIHSDEELEKVIKELLHHSHRMDASDITVSVNNFNVTLSGSVKSQDERDYAVSIAHLVQGVGVVENNLIVKLNEGILPTDIGGNP
jgi:osmotically-inducible protein OsmY